jgi:hypothetical protein
MKTLNHLFILAAGNTAGGSPMMTGLAPGTKYYIRSYVIGGKDVIYGNEKSFTTFPSSPVITQMPERKSSRNLQVENDVWTSGR